jgi:hypothetical protein
MPTVVQGIGSLSVAVSPWDSGCVSLDDSEGEILTAGVQKKSQNFIIREMNL